MLVSVDAFDQGECHGECEEGAKVGGGLFGSRRGAFEGLELSEGVCDTRSSRCAFSRVVLADRHSSPACARRTV